MNPASNLVLVGPMGAGKSTLGRRLAERLGLAFVDLDHEIETTTGATIPMIFEHEGEAGFRARESALIAQRMQGRDQVVATGGGAVLDADNRRLLAARAFVVYLPLSVDAQLERLARDRQRPLLAAPDRRARLEELAAARNPLYRALADLEFATEGLAPAVAGDRLADLLQAHWRREAAA